MRKSKRKLLQLAASILMLTINAAAQDTAKTTTHSFSMQQTVDYGMKNATQVKNALLDIKIQKQTNREITSAALPQINGNAISNTLF